MRYSRIFSTGPKHILCEVPSSHNADAMFCSAVGNCIFPNFGESKGKPNSVMGCDGEFVNNTECGQRPTWQNPINVPIYSL